MVAGSSPAFGTTRRSSSVVEHVFPVRLLSVGLSAGRRLWVLVDPAISVQIRSVACDGGATLSTPGNSTVAFLPALFDGPKTSGYLSLVRIQSGAQDASVAKWYSNSRVVPCPSFFRRVEWRDDSTATINPGGSMANNTHDWEESNFEITSKRRKGFPSETQVKRGVRIVHGNKELIEKLGRNDLCPCGSGHRF